MPGSIANTIFDRNADALREEIGDETMLILPQLDPTFRSMVLNSMSSGAVEIERAIGRDLIFRKQFQGSMAGVIRPGHQSSYYSLVGDATTGAGQKMYLNQVNQLAPDPFDGPNPLPFGYAGTLHSLETNLALSATMLRLEATPANIKQYVNPLIKGFGWNIALYACNSWFADPSQQFRLASLGTDYTVDASARTITFTPVEKTIHKFAVGQAVDIFSDATTRENEDGAGNRVLVFVAAVDPWKNEVVLVVPTGESVAWIGPTALPGSGSSSSGSTTLPFGATAFVCYADSYNSTLGWRGFYPWRAWAVWGGATDAENRILRGQAITTDPSKDTIDIRNHPEFKSGYFGSVGTLTETKLLQYLERLESFALMHRCDFDTGLFAEGIWLDYFKQYQGRTIFDRGRPAGESPGTLRNQGFSDEFEIVSGTGKRYSAATSRMLEDGLGFFYRRMNNFALIAPPGDGSRAASEVSGQAEELDPMIPLEWMMPALTENGSARVPVFKAGSSGVMLPSEFFMMPAWLRMQYVAVNQIPMMVLDGINSSRVWTAT